MSQIRTNSIVPAGGVPAGADGGGIIQVVQTIKTDSFSTTSSSLVDITGLSVSITPRSTSNKILIVCNINGLGADTAAGSYGHRLQLVRNTTAIGQGDARGSRQRGTATLGGEDNWPFYQHNTITYLDSPSTTSSTTYKVQTAHTQSATQRINAGDGDPNSSTYGLTTISTITVMEISG